MTQFLVVQTGETLWEQEQRLDSLAGAPLTDAGRDTAVDIAKKIDGHEPTVIYAPGAQAEMETAELIADRNSIRIRTENGLSEIDYGLWQGLRVDEIKRRQPRLQKQWQEAPSGVRPPGGETLAEAQERVWNTVVSIVRKSGNEVPLLVMRPVVLGLLRCRMLGVGLDDIWGHVREESGWTSIEVEDTAGDVMMTEEKTEDG